MKTVHPAGTLLLGADGLQEGECDNLLDNPKTEWALALQVRSHSLEKLYARLAEPEATYDDERILPNTRGHDR
jgi:hypothetical protein